MLKHSLHTVAQPRRHSTRFPFHSHSWYEHLVLAERDVSRREDEGSNELGQEGLNLLYFHGG